jgi:two-component system nitrate/nitrite response regulator NarL
MTDRNISILIADDHVMIRDGICALLELEPDVQVLDVAEDGKETLTKAEALQPDIVLMDIRMPKINGVEATRLLKQEHPNIRVLCMSVHHEKTIVDSIMKGGASGYIVKGNAAKELVPAIRAVAAGKTFFCSTISRSE